MKVNILLICGRYSFMILLVLISLEYGSLRGQVNTPVGVFETKLADKFQKMEQSRDDSVRFRINEEILKDFAIALALPGAEKYPFDSLTRVARISSGDDKFRILHWNIQQQNGIHRYYGFIQSGVRGEIKLTPLTDRSDSIEGPDSLILDAGNWFGALYYRVIPGISTDGLPIYTLLGWSGENSEITSKVIEILTFRNDVPQFGLPVFNFPDSYPKTRIIFRFSAGETMTLKYEEQVLRTSKSWNPRKRVFEEKQIRDRAIVFDHLVPIDPVMEGQPKFYIPSGDDYDGFVMEKGKWNFLRGIESRNNPH